MRSFALPDDVSKQRSSGDKSLCRRMKYIKNSYICVFLLIC